jgi:hypothetical protein
MSVPQGVALLEGDQTTASNAKAMPSTAAISR